MNLDEAIKHCEEVAMNLKEKGFEANVEANNATDFGEKCYKCAEEHRQLAEWLKELKAYKEQSGDAISRQAVLEFIGKQIDHSLWAYEKLVNGIKDLPSVTPQQKIGRWKFGDTCGNQYDYYEWYICSICKETVRNNLYNYCPQCGAKMQEVEE